MMSLLSSAVNSASGISWMPSMRLADPSPDKEAARGEQYGAGTAFRRFRRIQPHGLSDAHVS